MQIRDYTPSDAPAITRLFRRSIEALASDAYTAEQRRAWWQSASDEAGWLERLRPLRTWVADSGGQLAGFIALSTGGVVEFLYVAPEHARQGVASALYTRLEAYAREEGHQRLTTEASVVSEPFFGRQGFEVVRRNTVCRGEISLSNTTMAKLLDAIGPSTTVIVNGSASGGRCAARARPYLERLEGALEIRWTDGPGDATHLARQAAQEGADRVIAVGGDGTLFEVVNGLMTAERPPPALGILPLGTGNSFVRDVGLADPDAAFAALQADRRRPIDVIRAEHAEGIVYSINLLSVGFSADAGALTNRRFKGLGAAGYICAVLVSLARLRHPVFPVSLDDGPTDRRPCTLLSFSNSRYTGGQMMMAPDADPSDGRLDVVRVGPMGRRRFLSCFPRIFKGTHAQMPEVELTTASTVAFELEQPVDVMIDGEVLALQLTGLQVVPGALQVVA